MSFGDGYLLIRHFDDKLDQIISKLDGLVAADTERAALRQQVADLIAAANMAQADKDALAAKINDAFVKSEATESKMRAAVPT